jgi:hypothetical protein
MDRMGNPLAFAGETFNVRHLQEYSKASSKQAVHDQKEETMDD